MSLGEVTELIRRIITIFDKKTNEAKRKEADDNTIR